MLLSVGENGIWLSCKKEGEEAEGSGGVKMKVKWVWRLAVTREVALGWGQDKVVVD